MNIKVIKRMSPTTKPEPTPTKPTTEQVVQSWITDTQARKMQELVEAKKFWSVETASVSRSSEARGLK